MRAARYSERHEEQTMLEHDVERVTAEELAQRPNERCELEAGQVVDVAPASYRHGLVARQVQALLHDHARAHDCGQVTSSETGFLLTRNPDTVRAPDVGFVSTASFERWRKAETTYFPGAPDLAVEVLSPHDAWVEVEAKVREYLAAGGQAVWVLNPRSETVYVYAAGAETRVLGPDDSLDASPLLPGLVTPVRGLFDLV